MGFREYFAEHADLADALYQSGHTLICYVTATAAIDALAAIWLTDFPTDAANMRTEFGGTPPSAVRMARFVRRFAAGDPRTEKIAVVRFAEDAKRMASLGVATAEVDALLAARMPKMRGQLPPSHLDLDLSGLAREAPTLMGKPAVRRLAEEYQYPALLYSLYRCPTVHTFGWSKQTQGFVRNEEIMYMNLHKGFTSIGFGPKLATNWLRHSLDGYLEHCARAGVKPAGNMNAGAEHEDIMRRKWAKI